MQWRSSLVVLCVGIGAIGKQHLAEGRASNVYCVVQGRALVRVSNVDLSISGDQRSGDLASHESVGLVVELGNGASRTMLMAVVGRARRMVAVGFGERRANGSAVGVVQGDEAREVGEREVRARAGIGAADGRDVDDVVAALAHERAVHVGERVGAHLSCRDAREQQAMQRRQALRIASVEVGIALAEDGLHLLQAPDRDGGVEQICTHRSVSQSHAHKHTRIVALAHEWSSRTHRRVAVDSRAPDGIDRRSASGSCTRRHADRRRSRPRRRGSAARTRDRTVSELRDRPTRAPWRVACTAPRSVAASRAGWPCGPSTRRTRSRRIDDNDAVAQRTRTECRIGCTPCARDRRSIPARHVPRSYRGHRQDLDAGRDGRRRRRRRRRARSVAAQIASWWIDVAAAHQRHCHCHRYYYYYYHWSVSGSLWSMV